MNWQNLTELAKEVKEIPDGTYPGKIKRAELKESQNGFMMVQIVATAQRPNGMSEVGSKYLVIGHDQENVQRIALRQLMTLCTKAKVEFNVQDEDGLKDILEALIDLSVLVKFKDGQITDIR